jgi:hypothetical protein
VSRIGDPDPPPFFELPTSLPFYAKATKVKKASMDKSDGQALLRKKLRKGKPEKSCLEKRQIFKNHLK